MVTATYVPKGRMILDYYTLPRAVRIVNSGLKETKTLWEKIKSLRGARAVLV